MQSKYYDDGSAKVAASLSDHMRDTLKDASAHIGDSTPEAALSRGKVFHLAGYYEDAGENYTAATESKSDGDEAAARLAIVQMLSRQPEKALATATALASRNPGFEFKEATSDQYVSALSVLGDALAFNGRMEEAIDAYSRARSTARRDAAAAGRLAQMYLATGQPQKALELRQEVAKNPRFAHLSRTLEAGVRNERLLTSFGPNSVDSFLAIAVHGRPLLVEEAMVKASVVEGDAQWCADI